MVHDLPLVTIRRRALSSMDNNVYLLTSKQTGAQVLVDAADDLPAIRRLLADAAADAPGPVWLRLVVTTHAHWDHVRALRELVDADAVPTAAGAADVAAIEARTGVRTDRPLRHGDLVDVDGLVLRVIGLRGHTPGSVALAYEPPTGAVHLFTGDSLFPGGLGSTDHDPERFASLYADVTSRVFDRYGDDTVVHPGHGLPTTLGAERPHLDQWRERGW